MEKTFTFSVHHESQGVLIDGTATVVGEYDGPSKPEAMARAALAKHVGKLEVTIVSSVAESDV